jgi:sugar/nucleoside kinase (ribokinase family)
MTQKSGFFCGLTTVDIIYLVDSPPVIDEKIAAIDHLIVSGSPATNAAVTFASLKGKSTLASVVGGHPLVSIVHNELEKYHISHIELAPGYSYPPALSSVMVKKNSGERSVVSINAIKTPIEEHPTLNLSGNTDILLVDGHQMAASIDACSSARDSGIPCVMDAGSWKDRTEELLPLIDYAICSERFLPPNCSTYQDVIEYALSYGIKYTAITRGGKPIICSVNGQESFIEVQNENIVDTLES